MVDLQSDRLHRTKRNRPFAIGALPVAGAVAAVPILIAGWIGIALLLPPLFLAALLSYAAVTTLYSFFLKGR